MNKESQTKEYLEKLNEIKLSQISRDRISNNLLEYARFHSVNTEGVRIDNPSRSIEQVPQRTSILNRFLNLKHMTAALLIAIMIGGGTSFAARDAVPGDVLYPVKIEVNENVKSALAVSSESEARLQAHLVETRLAEAEKLATEGKLTKEASTDLSSRIKSHFEMMVINNLEVEADGDYRTSVEVRSSVEGAFRSYASVLSDLNVNVVGNEGSSLITQIKGYADTTADAQVKATTSVSADMKSQISATLADVEESLKETQRELTKQKIKLSAEAYARLEAKLAEALELHAEAEASLRAEVYQQAYTASHTAMRILSEIKSSLNSMVNLSGESKLDVEAVMNGLFGSEKAGESGGSTTATTSPKNNGALDTDIILNGDVDINSSIKDEGDEGGIESEINTEVNLNTGVNTNVGGSLGL